MKHLRDIVIVLLCAVVLLLALRARRQEQAINVLIESVFTLQQLQELKLKYPCEPIECPDIRAYEARR
jgi:hypothetical protein